VPALIVFVRRQEIRRGRARHGRGREKRRKLDHLGGRRGQGAGEEHVEESSPVEQPRSDARQSEKGRTETAFQIHRYSRGVFRYKRDIDRSIPRDAASARSCLGAILHFNPAARVYRTPSSRRRLAAIDRTARVVISRETR